MSPPLAAAAQMPSGAAPTSTSPKLRLRDWYMVLVLMLFLVLSFIDRSALFLLVAPIKKDLGLSDTQMSFLLGVAFAAIYTLVGVPAGYLLDRFNRRNLILSAVLLWTVMTGMSGFASSFALLLFFRTGVGLGEAFLSPAAMSMIRDTFPLATRGRAFSLYNLGIAFGGGASLLLVGFLLKLFPGDVSILVPMLGEMRPWQAVLAIIGFGGVPIALLALTLREPGRSVAPGEGEASPSFAAAWVHVKAHWAVYLPLLLFNAFGGIAIFGYNAWIPTAISRLYGVAPPNVGMALGTLHLVASPLGLLACGVVFDTMVKRRGTGFAARVGGAMIFFGAMMTVAATQVADVRWTWALLALQLFTLPWAAIAGSTILTVATPGRMTAKLAAVGFIALNLIGLGLGPTLIAATSDYLLGGGPRAIGDALSIVCGGSMAVSALCLAWCSAGLRRHFPVAVRPAGIA